MNLSVTETRTLKNFFFFFFFFFFYRLPSLISVLHFLLLDFRSYLGLSPNSKTPTFRIEVRQNRLRASFKKNKKNPPPSTVKIWSPIRNYGSGLFSKLKRLNSCPLIMKSIVLFILTTWAPRSRLRFNIIIPGKKLKNREIIKLQILLRALQENSAIVQLM